MSYCQHLWANTGLGRAWCVKCGIRWHEWKRELRPAQCRKEEP